MELLRLEKTSKIIKSNHHPITTMPTKPCSQVPLLPGFWRFPGMGTPPMPWEAWSNACSKVSQLQAITFWGRRIHSWSAGKEYCFCLLLFTRQGSEPRTRCVWWGLHSVFIIGKHFWWKINRFWGLKNVL